MCSIICILLHAQNKDTLQNIEISTKKISENAQSVVPVQKLNALELSLLNSFSVADAVKSFSGVIVKDYGGIGGLKTISVRSLGANHTGILYDGITLSDVQNGQIDLGKLSLENIASIKLYDAQPAALLLPAGAFSYGSLLALTTLTTQYAEKKSYLSAGFRTGSFGLVNPYATVIYRWNTHLDVSVSSEWQQANGRYNFTLRNGDSTKKMERTNADIQSFRLEGDIKYAVNENNHIDAKIYHYNSDRGLPGAVILYTLQGAQRLWDDQFFAQAKWENKISAKSQLLVSGKYNYSYNRYLDPNFQNNLGKLDNIYSQKELYISGVYAYQFLPGLQVSCASDFFSNTMDFKTNVPDGASTFAYPTCNTWLNNIVLQIKQKKWQLDASLLSTTVDNKVRFGTKPADYQQYTPFAGAMFHPWEKVPLHFRIFYKDIFRMPTFNDLYYTNVGNTALRPEFAKQYNAGLVWEQNVQTGFLESFSISADAYYNNVKDKIVAIPTQNLFQWSMQNYGKVSIKGIDANARFYFKPVASWHFSLYGNYTYQQALDVTDPASALYKNQLPYMPKNSGSAHLNIGYKEFLFSYNALFSDARYTLGQNSYATYMPPWNTQDMVLAYSFTCSKQVHWKLMAELNNIFNKQYNIINYYPMPGRNFRLGIQVRI